MEPKADQTSAASSPAQEPDVSVVIPAYNHARFLPETIESVLAQRGARVEIIVVDDGSTDETPEVCARHAGRIICLRQENAGVCAALNAGVARARGEFLHIMGADDLLSPGFCETMVPALRSHPGWGAAVCGTLFVHGDGRPSPMRQDPPPTGRLFRLLVTRNVAPVGAVLVRRALAERVGPFDTTLKRCEDWDFWIRVARTGAVFGAVRGHHFLYRIHGANKSRVARATYDSMRKVLTVASQPDPRVREPDPEFAAGSCGEEPIGEFAASMALGVALGSGDLPAAQELLAIMLKELQGRDIPHKDCLSVFFHAAFTAGALPPVHPDSVTRFWPALAKLTVAAEGDAAASRCLETLVLHCFGTTRYHRLAGTFPVRQMLWARRRLLGIPDPPAEERRQAAR